MLKNRLRFPATLIVLVGAFLLTGASLTAHAQVPGTDSCPAGVRDAFAQLDAVCTGIDRNEACYVANNVVAAFFEDVDENTFAQPSDRVGVEQIRQLSTAPFDPVTGEWGVAVMRVQANLPNTLPGQGVIFVMVGDVSLENAVDPNEAIALADPISATATDRVNVRSGPATTFNVVDVLEAGGAIAVDGRNEGGDWLRGVVNGAIVWVSTGAVNFPGDVNSLPVIADSRYGAMQAFTMSTGIGNAECEDAPNSLLVQAPQQVEVTLNVNGLDVTVGSTVVFDTPNSENLRVSVLDGSATLPSGVVVPVGGTVQGRLNDDGFIEDEAEFDDVDQMDENDWEDFDEWDDIESDVLNYDFDFDEEAFLEDVDEYDEYDEYDDYDDYDEYDEYGYYDEYDEYGYYDEYGDDYDDGYDYDDDGDYSYDYAYEYDDIDDDYGDSYDDGDPYDDDGYDDYDDSGDYDYDDGDDYGYDDGGDYDGGDYDDGGGDYDVDGDGDGGDDDGGDDDY